jgi:hypothetical protein
VPARIGTPGPGGLGGGYPLAGDVSAAIGWRYQKSDRHYVGSEYQGRRDELGNQVINNMNMADLSLRYQATRRVEVAIGIPYFVNTRSQTLATTPALTRYQTAARGIGDVLVATRRFMFDPDTHTRGNLQFGAGVQFPTGSPNQQDTFQTLVGTTITPAIRNVDQSIQPGEGGWGFLGDAMAFRTLSKMSLYVNAAYLLAPEEDNGVLNGAGTGTGATRFMSVYDQFFLRGGAGFPIKGAVSGGAAIRVEGVPAHDLVGGQFGFRRPGVAVSFEPSISIRRGRNSFDVAVPIATYRNRFQSAADELTGGHGDAAFAKWLLMASVSRKF